MKKFQKCVIIFFSLLIMTFLYCIFFPITYHIQRELNGYEAFTQDETYTKSTHIVIDGTYTFRLFGDDHFKGTLSINDYDVTKETANFNISNQFGNLVYQTYHGQELDSSIFGIIKTNIFMNQITILKYDNNNAIDLETFYLISAPAKNFSNIFHNMDEFKEALLKWY